MKSCELCSFVQKLWEEAVQKSCEIQEERKMEISAQMAQNNLRRLDEVSHISAHLHEKVILYYILI